MTKGEACGFFFFPFPKPLISSFDSLGFFCAEIVWHTTRSLCLFHVAVRKDGTNAKHGHDSSIKCHWSFATMWQPGSDYLLLDRCSGIQNHNVRVQPTHLQILLRSQDPFEVLGYIYIDFFFHSHKSGIHVQPSDIIIQIFSPFCSMDFCHQSSCNS